MLAIMALVVVAAVVQAQLEQMEQILVEVMEGQELHHQFQVLL
jgi:hypothetical protein